jgi:hypothetical protein
MPIPSFWEPARTGLTKTIRITLLLTKIIVPVTAVIVALEKLGRLEQLAYLFNPFCRVFGLPGEAALPIVLGSCMNIYASLGAIAALNLSSREVTVIALVILTCHSLFMETPILCFAGLSPWRSVAIRLSGALFLGFVVNLVYKLWGG